jgi:hypothetical protein
MTAAKFKPLIFSHESESMLRTYLVCREILERERETSKRHVGEAHSVLTAAILLPQRLSCYRGKSVSLRMLTYLRLADLRLTTAQQTSTGQNLPSDLYMLTGGEVYDGNIYGRMQHAFCFNRYWRQLQEGEQQQREVLTSICNYCYVAQVLQHQIMW